MSKRMQPRAGVANDRRRTTLKGLGLAGIAGLGATFGLAPPALAADAPGWPTDAFKQKNAADAIKALYGKTPEKTERISLDVPEIAENGAVVPVSFSALMSGVTSMALMVAENPFTLAAVYTIPQGTEPSIACRLKMAKTSDVIALVEADGKLYRTSKQVKVTLGGCGG